MRLGATWAPRKVIDGYANGWRASRGCRDVELAFGPQRAITAGYALSAIACPLLLLWMLLALRRGRRAGAGDPERDAADLDTAPRRVALPPAGAIGVAAGLASGFLFGLRTGPGAALLVASVLWRGIGWRALLIAAVALLGAVVPAVYVLFPPTNLGGYNSDYPQSLIAAHWVGVAAFLALVLVLARSVGVSRARARRDGRGPGPAA